MRPGATAIERIYRGLLHAYPASFREDYESELAAAFRARWREAPNPAARAALFVSIVVDVLVTAVRSHAELTRRDLRFAARMLARHRSYATTAIATLALGIGAVTLVFSVAWAVLSAPLPYRDPSRLVSIYATNAPLGLTQFSESIPNFVSLRHRTRSFAGLAALKEGNANITVGTEPERLTGLAVSPNFFDVLGLPALAGRSFVAADARPGVDAVMISRGFWARRFGSNPAAIGSRIDVNLRPHVIVGVAPQDVGFRDDVDLWTLIDLDQPEARRGDRRLTIIGRLAPGASPAQARDDLERVARSLEADYPTTGRDWRYAMLDMREWIVGPELPVRLRLLLAAVTLLLVVAAVNVASLQLARTAGRLREIGVRLALGASPRRLARQILTETFLLALIGGVAGIGLAAAGARWAAARIGDDVPRAGAIAIDIHVLVAALVATVATALLAGLIPAILTARSSIAETIGQAGRSPAGTRSPVRRLLVGVQLALATLLVIGAALLTRSLLHLQQVPLGFADPSRLLLAEVTRSQPTVENRERDLAFYDALIARVTSLPGVVAAGISNAVPFGSGNTSMSIQPYPSAAGAATPITASWRVVSHDYFNALGIPLVAGRIFDRPATPQRVLIVSATLARALWPDGSAPSGRTVRLGNGQVFTVIGQVGDARLVDLARRPVPTMYLPTSVYLWPTMTLTVRTAVDPDALVRPIREAVAALDPHQPLGGVQTMSAAIADSVAAPRLNTWVAAAFALLALLLAAIGVAGLISSVVVERAPELAVRMAIGASPRRAVWHVLQGALVMAAVGIAGGALAARACRPLLASVLFGIAPTDPSTYVTTAAMLLAVAMLSAWLPARRSARIDPASLLR